MFYSLDITEQRQAYELLMLKCRKTFKFEEPGSGWTFFRYSDHCKDNDDYGLSIFDGPKTFGISLDGHDYSPKDKAMRMVLKFATYGYESGIGKTAGLLAASPKGRVALLHDGRVSTAKGRGSPFRDKIVLVSGKKYYFISYLDDVKLLSRLVAFQRSRTGEMSSTSVKVAASKDAYDPGSAQGGTRVEVFFESRHHTVTSALKKAVTAAGWRISRVIGISPDLAVEKNDSRILFEVKPSSSSHDLMMGISQLMIYNKFVSAERTCIVTSSPPPSNALEKAINEFILENNIDYIKYSAGKDAVVFHGLSSVLR